MTTLIPIEPAAKWLRVVPSDADWTADSKHIHAALLEQLFVIRHFEETLLQLHNEGLVHGPVHASIGQEGGAVGCMSALEKNDKINGTHRMHHQFLAKALNAYRPADYDPRLQDLPEDFKRVVTTTLAEIMGLSPGYCGGRGGSMHLRYPDAGILGSNAIVGGNIPHAVGYALADKLSGRHHVSVAFFGDGATQIGTTYESINLAALYDLPVIFFIENNQYAVSTGLREQTREIRLSSRGVALGVPSLQVDGMDVVAVRKAVRWAKQTIAEDTGPVVIESETYRYLHQSGPNPGSMFGYRSKDEENKWHELDPVARYPNELQKRGIVTAEVAASLRERAAGLVDEAIRELTSTDSAGTRRIKPRLWPSSTEVEIGIRGDLSELADSVFLESEDIPESQRKKVKYVDCIGLSTLRNMEKFPNMFVLGEDVQHLKGGTSGGTRGVSDAFPDRLLGTPICENGFVGMAVGAALNGMRPLVEIMYPDFCLVAADQLFNQAAKVSHMFGGGFPVPLVVRSRVSAGTGYGSQHSMDAAGLFMLYPGWRIVAPSTPHDYIGLMNAAVRCNDPVLVVDHNDLYQTEGPIPADDLDYVIPFGSAKIRRSGAACTVLTYLSMVNVCLEAAEETGLDAEVIDLRTLDLFGLDYAQIETSLKKTGRLVVVEQTTRGTSIGARIIEELQSRYFDLLKQKTIHVTGTHSSPVVSKVLEEAALAGFEDVADAFDQMVEETA